MKTYFQVVAICAGLILAACSTTKVSSTFPEQRKKIVHLTALEPKIHLERLQAGATVIDADNINNVKLNYLNAMREVVPETKVEVHKMDYIDATTYAKLIDQFFWGISREKVLDNFEIEKELQDVLRNSPHDYAVVGSVTGFSRSGGSYALGIAKGVLIGVLTLGMFYTVPVGSSANINLAVIDKATMKVIYFDTKGSAANPKDYDVIKGLEKKIFKNYIAKN